MRFATISEYIYRRFNRTFVTGTGIVTALRIERWCAAKSAKSSFKLAKYRWRFLRDLLAYIARMPLSPNQAYRSIPLYWPMRAGKDPDF